MEDSSHEIQSELPILPVSANSSGGGGAAANGTVSEDAVLATLSKIAIIGRDLLETRLQPPWLRVLGEIHYAQSNYAVRHSVKNYFYFNISTWRTSIWANFGVFFY